jgi:hypothetical protein
MSNSGAGAGFFFERKESNFFMIVSGVGLKEQNSKLINTSL